MKAFTDMLDGLGWTSGLRSAIKSMEPEAWWQSHTPSSDWAAIVRHLMTAYQYDQNILDMF